jgi:hypothetical protein
MHKDRALDMIAGRCDGHTVRLIHHEKVLIPINNSRFVLDRRFSRDFLPVENGEAMPVYRVASQLRAVAESDLTFSDAIPPDIRIDLGKSREDILEYRLWRRVYLGKVKTLWSNLHQRF